MNLPRSRIVSSSIPGALDRGALFLLLLAAIALSLHMTVFQDHPTFRPLLYQAMRVLSLAVSVLLLCSILLQSLQARREVDLRQEEPASLPDGARPVCIRFLCEAGEQGFLPGCIDFLERNFGRYFSFHRFHPPFLHYYYLAKTAGTSLYAPAWIRIGMLAVMVACYASLSGHVSLMPAEAAVLLVLVLVFFWLPGVLIIFRSPYVKLWVSWVELPGSVQITLTAFSPFGERGFNRLAGPIETTFGNLRRLPIPEPATVQR